MNQLNDTSSNEHLHSRAALRAGVMNILLVGAANFDGGRTHLCVSDMLLADMIMKMLEDHFMYSGERKADYIPQTQDQSPQGDLALKIQEVLLSDEAIKDPNNLDSDLT